jgi:hypothetical protein
MEWSEHLALTCSLAVSMTVGSIPLYWVAANRCIRQSGIIGEYGTHRELSDDLKRKRSAQTLHQKDETEHREKFSMMNWRCCTRQMEGRGGGAGWYL